MTSSADDLINLIFDQLEVPKAQRSGNHHAKEIEEGAKWTTEQINNMLNIELDDADQVEGNVHVRILGSRRFFSWDNHTIEQLPKLLNKAAQALRSGQEFNRTKFYNPTTIKIGFPTATGLPFIYSYNVPSLVQIGGEAKLKTKPELVQNDKIQMPKIVNASIEVEMIYSSKVQAKMAVITPFNHKMYMAGLDRNLHLNLPIRVELDIDTERREVNAQVQPLELKQRQKVFESSLVAFTTKQDILDFIPPQQTDEAREIHVRKPARWQYTAGQESTGFAFDLLTSSEEPAVNMAAYMNAFKKHDLMTALMWPQAGYPIANRNFSIVFNPKQTSAKKAKLFFMYDDDEQPEEDPERLQEKLKQRKLYEQNGAEPKSYSPDSSKRRQQFLLQAGAGIRNSYTQVVDMAVEFVGQTNAQYVATAAYSRSPVSNQTRVLAYFGKDPAQSTRNTRPLQASLDVTLQMPNVPLVNYKKALRQNATSNIEAHLNFGEKLMTGSHVYLEGVMGQTDDRISYVKRQPLAKLCETQMDNEHYILPACRNVTARANFLNQYNFTIQFQKISENVKNLTYQAYSIARHLGYNYISENFIDFKNKDGQIDIAVEFAPSLKTVNVSLDTPMFSSQFTNVSVNPLVRPLVVLHPEYSAAERVAQHLLKSRQYPTCVVDKAAATTFDNRTYSMNLGNCWHVMFQTASPSHPDSVSTQEDDYEVSVLVRDSSTGKKELKVILGPYEVGFIPELEVMVNGKKAKFSQDKLAEYIDKHGQTLVQVYELPDSSIRFFAPQHGIEIIYDGFRVKLQVTNSYRGDVRGLCGTFDGEQATDFTTPKNCILRDPFEFAASYALPVDSCTGPAKDLRHKAQKSECYKQETILGDVINDAQAWRIPPRQKNHKKISNSLRQKASADKPCSSLRVKLMEVDGKICFSLKPLLTCSSKCKAIDSVEKSVDFHCIEESKAARHWASMVRKGANPDFSAKGANKRAVIRLPGQCLHN